MPFAITKELSFCYGHRLLNYEGKCRHLHGHNAQVEIELQADALDHRGMVHDFTDVKLLLGAWLDNELDHRTILRSDDPLLPLLQAQGQPLFVMDDNPTAENLARLIFDYALQQGLPITAVRFWETLTSCAVYSPCNGPRKQEGHCIS